MPVTTNTRKLAALLGASGAGIGTDGLLQAAAVDANIATQAEMDAGDNKISTNLAVLAIRQAADHNDVKYNLQDRIIDDYYDASGIDTGASTNESLTAGVYVGTTISNVAAQTVRKAYVSTSVISYTIPTGVTTATVELWGAGGGSGAGGSGAYYGGGGGYTKGDLTVTGGETLLLTIGQGGRSSGNHAGGGGGGTWIKRSTTWLAAAGGGGGAGADSKGGAGGGANGGDSTGNTGTGGGGATTTAVGSTGTQGSSGLDATVVAASGSNGGGVSAVSGGGQVTTNAWDGGGQGASDDAAWSIGGGGSGRYGGGGGGKRNGSGGGGGGSGYSTGMASVTTELGNNITNNSSVAPGGDDSSNYTSGIGVGGRGAYGNVGANGEIFFNFHAYQLANPGGNLTLQSTDTAAETEPDYADMVVLIEDAAGTATVNTDIKGFISEDSGVTFTEGVLVDEGDWGTNKRILAFHDLDISAQSGTAMCYKITTHNQVTSSKVTKIHATSIGWR